MASALQWRLILERAIDGWRAGDPIAERMLMQICRRLHEIDLSDIENSSTMRLFAQPPKSVPEDIQ